jgi:hypothetical protein
MKKIAFLIALLATLAAALPASGAVLLAKNCTSSCSTFQANGKGWLSVVGNGAEWGSISSGTIWLRDSTGRSNPKNWLVQHAGELHWTYLGDDGFKVTSTKSMRFSASAKFWIKLEGPGITVSGVFDGTGRVAGSGKYQIGSKSWHAWSQNATDLQF